MGFPVFRAFGAGIAYLFTHFLTIIRILWLPALLVMAVQIYVTPAMLDAQLSMISDEAAGQPVDPFAALNSMFKYLGYLYGAMAILYPMMYAGLLKHIVFGKAPRLPFYFQFGFDELRIVGAFVALLVLVLIVYFFAFLLIVLLTALSVIVNDTIGEFIFTASLVALGVVLIWFSLRMSVIYAAAIGDKGIGIESSWNLTAGRVWSLLLFWILWIAVWAIPYLALLLFLMPEIFSLAAGSAQMSSSQTIETDIFTMQRDIWDLSKPAAWLNMAGSYVFLLVYTAVTIVPIGVAYIYMKRADEGA